MTSSKEFNLASAYADLAKACSVHSYDKVVNISTKILAKNPGELKAFQCKVVALIRTEKYDECLNLMKKFPELSNHVLFEKAYVKYRLNQINDASKTLELIDSNSLNVLELKAQLHYRKEEFSQAYTALRQVIRNHQDGYEEERITNLTAIAAAAACFKDADIPELDITPETYEAKFNMACYHLGRKDYKSASKLLKESEDTCRATLSEDSDVTEEEINEELVPIKVQCAYSLQLEGKDEQANQLYQSVMRQRSLDPAVVAVIANNIICINKEQNIFDSRKRIKMCSTDGLQHKLFSKQRNDIMLNQALLYWYTNQVDASQAKVRTVMQEDVNSPRALLLSVANFLKEKHYEKAIDVLQKCCSQFAKSGGDIESPTLNILLTLAQLHLRLDSNGCYLPTGLPNPKSALYTANLFKELLPESILHSSGILSTRIALYLLASSGSESVCSRTDASEQAVQAIREAVDWHDRSPEKGPVYSRLLDQCSAFLLEQGQAKMAAQLVESQLEQLNLKSKSSTHNQTHLRNILLARLVRAYAKFDLPRAQEACKSIQLTDSLSEADVDTLETAFLYGAKSFKRAGRPIDQDSSTKGKQTPSGLVQSDNKTQDIVGTKRRRKKRKIRLPKNYQPGVMPDPERWLPRRERGHNRGKRRDKRFISSRGPQGQVTGGAEWDVTTRSPKPQLNTSPRDHHSGASSGNSNISTPKQVSAAVRQQQRKGRKK